MRKPLLFLLTALLLTAATPSVSQLRIALVGGPTFAGVTEKNSLPMWDSIKNGYSSRSGLHFGFTGDLQMGMNSKFYFQPGFIFTNKGRKYAASRDSVYDDGSGMQSYSYFEDGVQYINYIDLPLNIVYKTPVGKNTKFMAGAGPYLSFFFNGVERKNMNLSGVDFKSVENKNLQVGNGAGKYKTLDMGVNALAGFEFRKFFLNLNYSKGLSDFYQATYDGSFKHKTIGATLGIFIGQPVDLSDKPKDRDNDGVPDTEDLCPEEPGTALTKGCPDADGDGVPDKTDKCPAVKGLEKYAGCPIPDTDKDGVNDEEDKCPDVAGVKDNNGCPEKDTDGDSIIDKEDKCPDIPGLARYQGCPIPDSDGDGINDEEDKCPDVAGIKENNGCPEIKQEIIEKVSFAARQVQFEIGKNILLPESKQVLDEVAAILSANTELKIDIEGHTSSEGNKSFNDKLSQQRANAVKDYLVSKGVDPSRLTATGFGSSHLLNEEKTEAARALNRRVELKLTNN